MQLHHCLYHQFLRSSAAVAALPLLLAQTREFRTDLGLCIRWLWTLLSCIWLDLLPTFTSTAILSPPQAAADHHTLLVPQVAWAPPVCLHSPVFDVLTSSLTRFNGPHTPFILAETGTHSHDHFTLCFLPTESLLSPLPGLLDCMRRIPAKNNMRTPLIPSMRTSKFGSHQVQPFQAFSTSNWFMNLTK
jgi:hypothetical protein